MENIYSTGEIEVIVIQVSLQDLIIDSLEAKLLGA